MNILLIFHNLTQTVFSVKVRYRYESQLTDELDLMVGDVVSVLDDKLEDDGWWFGELAGVVGVFPNNFVEVGFWEPTQQFKLFFHHSDTKLFELFTI